MASPACIVVLCFALATLTFGAPNVDFSNYEAVPAKGGLENPAGHKDSQVIQGNQNLGPKGDQSPGPGQGNTDPSQGNHQGTGNTDQGQGNNGQGNPTQGHGNQGQGNTDQGQGNNGQRNQTHGNTDQGQGNNGQGNPAQGHGNQGQGNTDQGQGNNGQGNPAQGHGNQGQGNTDKGQGNNGQGNPAQGHGNQGQGNTDQGPGNNGQGNPAQGHGNQGQGNTDQGQGNPGQGNPGQGNGNQGNGNQGNGNQGQNPPPQPPPPKTIVYEFGTKSRYDVQISPEAPVVSQPSSQIPMDYKVNAKYTDDKKRKITYVRIETVQTGEGTASIVEGGIGTEFVNVAITAKASLSYQHVARFYTSLLQSNMASIGKSTAKDVILARVKGAQQYSTKSKAVTVVKYPGSTDKLKDKNPTYVAVVSKQTSAKLTAAITKGELKKTKDVEVTLTAEDTLEFDYEVIFYNSAARSQPLFFTAAVSLLVFLWSRVA